MDWNQVYGAVSTALVAIIALIGAGVLWLLPDVGRFILLRLRRDRYVMLTGALANAAELGWREVQNGATEERALQGMISYAQLRLPDTIKQLGITDDGLRDMAFAAWLRMRSDKRTKVKVE